MGAAQPQEERRRRHSTSGGRWRAEAQGGQRALVWEVDRGRRKAEAQKGQSTEVRLGSVPAGGVKPDGGHGSPKNPRLPALHLRQTRWGRPVRTGSRYWPRRTAARGQGNQVTVPPRDGPWEGGYCSERGEPTGRSRPRADRALLTHPSNWEKKPRGAAHHAEASPSLQTHIQQIRPERNWGTERAPDWWHPRPQAPGPGIYLATQPPP